MIAEKTSNLAAQLKRGETVGITFHSHNKRNIKFLGSLLKKILSNNDRIYLQDALFNIMREIIVNAVKANSKRIYFDYHHLDINDSEQYITGMENFKTYILENQDFIETELKKSNLRVEIYFKKTENGLNIYVRNNTPIHPDELLRVQERMEKAKEYHDFSDVYGDISDDSEGEGLGLVLSMLLLRNSGIGENSLKIKSDGKITQTSFIIPDDLKPKEIVSKIQNMILEEIKDLPSIPQNIYELEKLCVTPDVSFKDINDKIIMDPALSASVLRLANSAGFISRKKINSVLDAVKVIGLKNLRAILVASSARKILDEKYSMYKEIWNHCNKVAFYAKNLAIRFGYQKLTEQVYLAGLLHDLGKIVLLSTSGALSEWISTVTMQRSIRSSTIIEELSIGISHSTIGEMIARKWNLPEYLIESIKNHHSPMNKNEKYSDIVNIVYLANEMVLTESKKYDHAYIEDDVLTKFDLNSETDFLNIHGMVSAEFDEQQALFTAAQ
jgi:putative nucleotidyltransferase with HDIG domain